MITFIDVVVASPSTSVQFLGPILCGGSLIAPNVVLTAAHCYHDQLAYVSVNTWEFNGPIGVERGGAQHVSVSRIERHPRFDVEYFGDYDFMLLELSESINNVAFMIVNPDDGHPKEGEEYVVIGLGRTDPNDQSSLPNVLQELKMEMIGTDECNSKDMHGGLVNDESMFCAAIPGITGDGDSCRGDSGGPIFYIDEENNNEQVQVGLVSWGGPICAQKDYASVYARVSSAHDWILDVVCDEWGYSNAPLCNGTSSATTDDLTGSQPDQGSEGDDDANPEEEGGEEALACIFGSETLFRLKITTDNNGYGSGLYWDLRDDDGNLVDGDEGFNDGETRVYGSCLSLEVDCYVLTVYDSDENHPGFCCDGLLDGDGQCCNGFKAGWGVLFGTASYNDFENPIFEDEFVSFNLCRPGSTPDNDNDDGEDGGQVEDGGGVASSTAPSADSVISTSPFPSPEVDLEPTNATCGVLTIDLRTDTRPEETSVFIFGDDYQILFHQSGFDNNATDYTLTDCFTGCLRIGLLDDQGDGLSPPGGVNITYDGQMLVQDLSDIEIGTVVMVGSDCNDDDVHGNSSAPPSVSVSTNLTDGDEDCEQFDLFLRTSSINGSMVGSSSSLFILVGELYDVLLHERFDFETTTDDLDYYGYTACLSGCVTVGVFDANGQDTTSVLTPGEVNVTYGDEVVDIYDFGYGVIFPIGKHCRVAL